MNDPNETSYYEVALTNRQVVVAFVALLTLLLTVFLSGVWVGKNGSQRLARAETPLPAEGDAGPESLANLEEFKFFSEGEETQAGLDKPDLSGLLQKPRPETTLAQDVGARGAPPPAAGSAAADTAPGVARSADTPPPQAPPKQAPAKQAPPPQASSSAPRPTTQSPPIQPTRSSSPADVGEWVVQVFSTHDEPQARKLLRQLESEGQPAFMSTVEVGGQNMFRVRVGPFNDRGRAESVSTQLRKTLRLDPWVTAASN